MSQVGRCADVERDGRHVGQWPLSVGEPAASDAGFSTAGQSAEPRPSILAIAIPHRQALPAQMHVEVPRNRHDMPLRHLSGDARLLYR